MKKKKIYMDVPSLGAGQGKYLSIQSVNLTLPVEEERKPN